jgi:hypothetical protein
MSVFQSYITRGPWCNSFCFSGKMFRFSSYFRIWRETSFTRYTGWYRKFGVRIRRWAVGQKKVCQKDVYTRLIFRIIMCVQLFRIPCTVRSLIKLNATITSRLELHDSPPRTTKFAPKNNKISVPFFITFPTGSREVTYIQLCQWKHCTGK